MENWTKKEKEIVRRQIMFHEGFSASSYTDTLGNKTIGFGFNLDVPGARDKVENLRGDYDAFYWGREPIDVKLAQKLLTNEILNALKYSLSIYPDFWTLLSFPRQLVIVDMIYNMGLGSYKEFKKHIAHVKDQQWEGAALEMRRSKWAKQVKNRSQVMSEVMESGNLPEGIEVSSV